MTGFRSYLVPTISNSFTNISYNPDVIFLPTKAFAMEYLLWHKYYNPLGIKNWILATHSFCKFT